MLESLKLSLWNALGLAASLLVISSVLILLGLAIHHYRRVARDLDQMLRNAMDFTGLFPEPKE